MQLARRPKTVPGHCPLLQCSAMARSRGRHLVCWSVVGLAAVAATAFVTPLKHAPSTSAGQGLLGHRAAWRAEAPKQAEDSGRSLAAPLCLLVLAYAARSATRQPTSKGCTKPAVVLLSAPTDLSPAPESSVHICTPNCRHHVGQAPAPQVEPVPPPPTMQSTSNGAHHGAARAGHSQLHLGAAFSASTCNCDACNPGGVDSVMSAVPEAAPAAATSAPAAAQGAEPGILCGGLAASTQTRPVGPGTRRANAQRSTRSARRAVGARLMQKPTAEPTVRSFDISKVRAKLQHGIRGAGSLRSGGRRREPRFTESGATGQGIVAWWSSQA
eukprot:s1657_g6.t2